MQEYYGSLVREIEEKIRRKDLRGEERTAELQRLELALSKDARLDRKGVLTNLRTSARITAMAPKDESCLS